MIFALFRCISFFFFKQKTAYEMRISDWSSDVCSSDLNGSLRIERNRVALPELLDRVVDMFRLQAAAKGLDFEYDRSPRLPGHVFTDEKRLRQILINLISNAIKYTPSGSASLTVRWRDPVAEFEIADRGVGIAEDG